MPLGTVSVLCGLAHLILSVQCAYFSQSNWSITLPFDFPVNASFAQLVALRGEDEGANQAIRFALIENESRQTPPVQVAEKTGLLSLTSRPKKHSVTFNVRITPSGKERKTNPSSVTKVTVTFSKVDVASWCSNSETACFTFTQLSLSVVENDPPQPITRPVLYNYQHICPNNTIHYAIKSEKENEFNTSFSINPESGEISTLKRLDREKFSDNKFKFRLECTVSNFQRQEIRKTASGIIQVIDVNDNGPELINGKHISLKLNEDLLMGSIVKLDPQILIKDLDSTPSNYSISLLGGASKFFNIILKQPFPGLTLVIRVAELEVIHPLNFEEDSYNFSVVFTDTEMEKKYGSNEVMLNISIYNFENCSIATQYYLTVNKTATAFTRVSTPFYKCLERLNDTEFSLTSIVDDDMPFFINELFAITPKTGIIYVKNGSLLGDQQLDNGTTIPLKLGWKSPTHSQRNGTSNIYITIITNYADEMNDTTNNLCTWSKTCAQLQDQQKCENACATGINENSCIWLTTENTCVADRIACRDGKCDELEDMNMNICPQDCTYIVVPVSYKAGHRGILEGAIGLGSCHCDPNNNYRCQCFPQSATLSPGLKFSSNTIPPRLNNSVIQHQTEGVEVQQIVTVGSAEENGCDIRCYSMIAGGLLIMFVSVTVGMVMWRRRTRRKIRSGKPKYLGSAISLSAVPSDYVDKRSSSVVSQTITVSEPLVNTSIKVLIPIDKRWEIPRSRLIIEQTIGEGEFGKVMRAKAFGIGGVPGFSTVAVKTLKSNGTNTELHDLLSEYTLLKEVSHPNVIKLLGACTSKEGPISIIVEYAEHGSLRSFLRKSRQVEFATYASEDSGVGSLFLSNTNGSTPNREHQVTPRDLLSFMWQISKGMSYLSDMKLVHRDLAARNILVAAGRLIKISDFGLSRDVYEGDTYFKTSKGRVPVKWMALESLVNHVYTSKSDVWSFGVIMWEIVMLGSTPYPGVPPERLFYLLRNGYRMEKPDNCSDDLYTIMRNCWHEDPLERPTFKELTLIFDTMLQENVEYLDLSFNIVHNMTYFEDQSIKDEEEEDSDIHYGSLNVLPPEHDYVARKKRNHSESSYLLSKTTKELPEPSTAEAEATV